ncbi:hypothetical protein [Sorangium cellulosum]|uniref:hypothetical protein n=1 Tax=Sorangium cellulosum TaxID=56 RepID=UPI001331ABD6|nr:hypothetical protein [Sorangium cellulosum]
MFVEAMLIDMHPDDVTRLAGKSFEEIATDRGVRVLSAMHVLATDNVSADVEIRRGEHLLPPQHAPSPEIELRQDAHDVRFEVRPRLVEGDAVLLRVVLELDGWPTHLPHLFISSVIVRNRQFVPFRTDFPARDGRLVVLLVKPEILRDQEGWRRFLERRKTRPRDAGPASPSSRGHGRTHPQTG